MKESEYRTNLGSEELLNKEYAELYFESCLKLCNLLDSYVTINVYYSLT